MCEKKQNERDPNQRRSLLQAVQPPQEQAQLPEPPQDVNQSDKLNSYMGFWWTSWLLVLGTAIIVAWIPRLISPEPPKGTLHGSVSPKLRKVEEMFRILLLSGEEKGAAFTVYHKGKLLVDVWGGYADIEAWQPWDEATIANSFSVFNVIISLCLGLLFDRGFLTYTTPIATYWPEFSVHGKELISTEMLLTRQAGLVKLNATLSLFDSELREQWLSQFLAEQKPFLPPGTFHDYDQGILELYVDQIVRRVDPGSRTLKQFFEEEFLAPEVIDFFIGLPPVEHHRAARVKGHGFSVLFEFFFAPLELVNTLMSYMRPLVYRELGAIARLNDPHIRSAPVGSFNGFTTARALALLYNKAVLSGDQERLISAQAWARMSKPMVYPERSFSRWLGLTPSHSYSCAGQLWDSPAGSTLIGYPGFGGQYAFVDVMRNLSVAYVTNYNGIYKSGLDPRFKSLLKALYDSLAIE